jgi:hypothetical protein
MMAEGDRDDGGAGNTDRAGPPGKPGDLPDAVVAPRGGGTQVVTAHGEPSLPGPGW